MGIGSAGTGVGVWSPGDNQAGLILERRTVLQVFGVFFFLIFMKVRVHRDAGTREQPRRTVQHSRIALRERSHRVTRGRFAVGNVRTPAWAAAGQATAWKAAIMPVPPWRDATAYSRTTVPPAASNAALIFSASSLEALALISCGRDSTSFFACGRDKVRDL